MIARGAAEIQAFRAEPCKSAPHRPQIKIKKWHVLALTYYGINGHIGNKNKKRVLLRATKTFIRKKMCHTT